MNQERFLALRKNTDDLFINMSFLAEKPIAEGKLDKIPIGIKNMKSFATEA